MLLQSDENADGSSDSPRRWVPVVSAGISGIILPILPPSPLLRSVPQRLGRGVRLRVATSVDHQLEKRQRFDQFVESVPYQKLSGPASPPFHSTKHWAKEGAFTGEVLGPRIRASGLFARDYRSQRTSGIFW